MPSALHLMDQLWQGQQLLNDKILRVKMSLAWSFYTSRPQLGWSLFPALPLSPSPPKFLTSSPWSTQDHGQIPKGRDSVYLRRDQTGSRGGEVLLSLPEKGRIPARTQPTGIHPSQTGQRGTEQWFYFRK